MKPYKYKVFRYKKKNHFRPSHRIHTAESRAVSTLGQVLLVLVGGFIGILGNQWFFESNKRLESKLELQREMAKDRIPHYLRIINFSANWIEQQRLSISSHTKIKETSVNGRITRIDTLSVKQDTVKYHVPSFVSDSIIRGQFINDINEIQKNKDKIEEAVWSKFMSVIVFLVNNPLPPLNGNWESSSWNKKEVQDKWYKANDELYSTVAEQLKNMY